MTSLSSLPKDTLLADVEALRAALAAAPVTDAQQKALYQCERLAARREKHGCCWNSRWWC